MFKKLFLLSVFFIISLYFNPTFAHVLHYQNLNRLEFDLYRNNELIGQHIYLFDRNGKNLVVHNKINFKIKVFGVTVYRYSSEGHENILMEDLTVLLLQLIIIRKKSFVKSTKKKINFS